MTIKLFHNDAYQVDFKGIVVGREDAGNRMSLALDQTCFYPNSGGQLCDSGSINGQTVIDVQQKEGQIIHFLEKNDSIQIGQKVVGRIDWNRRFDYMQQHTGQHILSGALTKIWGLETQSFHMSEEETTIDILQVAGMENRLLELEALSNQIIFENRSIFCYQKDRENVEDHLIKKIVKQDKRIRIVEIENFDSNACGGTHCKNTGEVGIIKIIRLENRKNKHRIHFLCGKRAFKDYQKKHQIIKDLTHQFTTDKDDLLSHMIQRREEQKIFKRRFHKIEQKLAEYELQDLRNNYRINFKDFCLFKKVYSERGLDYLKQMALNLINQEKCLVFLATKAAQPGICMACSREISCHMGKIMQKVLLHLPGKGGGSQFLAQCKGIDTKHLGKYFLVAEKLLIK